jgi:2-aminoethylphosphonate-pyruvate transaminase
MQTPSLISPSRDKLLFTPGPLTTSATVKQAMLRDAGSWHWEFSAKVGWIRSELLRLAGVSREAGWECVLMQGSGTFGVEAVFQTGVGPEGKVAVLTNGAYGERMLEMLKRARIPAAAVRAEESIPPALAELEALLARDAQITHVAAVHCETTTGILNPITEYGQLARKYGKVYVVDAMSSFGALQIDLEDCAIDYLVSSANKCVEGVPGFAFVLCRRAVLRACAGWSRSLSLDLLSQLEGFEKNGQFRFTPPTHSLLAFEQALLELEQEGGIRGRNARYRRNHAELLSGMARLGFGPFLPAELQSPIITAFRYPEHPGFSFADFYRRLSERGLLIYPGKLTRASTFRIGNIGRLFPAEMEHLVQTIEVSLNEAGVPTPVTAG